MALTIDQLRNYGSNWGNLVVDSDPHGETRVRGGGFWHAIGSMLGLSSVKERNRNTLVAIRTAIQTDKRYFAADVKERANQLLNGIGDGANVGTRQIKSLIRQLDAMSTEEKQRQAVRNVATGHLAVRQRPPELEGLGTKYAAIARSFALQRRAGEAYADIDVAARPDELDGKLLNVIHNFDGNPTAKAIFDAAGRHQGLLDNANNLKSDDKLDLFAQKVIVFAEEVDAIEDAEVRGCVMERIDNCFRSLPPGGAVTAIVKAAKGMPKNILDGLDANSSAGDIHKAMQDFAAAMDTAFKREAVSDDDDPYMAQAMQTLAVKCYVAMLPQERKEKVLAAFESETGRNMISFYTNNQIGRLNGIIMNVLDGVVTHLNEKLRDQPSCTMIEFPAKPDYSQVPDGVISQIAPQILSGEGEAGF